MPSSRPAASARAASLASSFHRAAQTILPRRGRSRRNESPRERNAPHPAQKQPKTLPSPSLGRLVTNVVKVCGELGSDGLGVRRSSSALHPSAFSPFLLLDHCGPQRVPRPGDIRSEEPRCGQQALTFVTSGKLHYADSCGNEAVLKKGSVSLLTAGSGLIVSHSVHGPIIEYFSIWINIPKEMRAAPPEQRMTENPPFLVTGQGESAARICVLAGPTNRDVKASVDHDIKRERSSVELETAAGSAAVYDVKMQRKSQLVLNPNTSRVFIYVYRGAALISKTTEVKEGDLAVLESNRDRPVVIDSVGVRRETVPKPDHDFSDFDTFEEHACWCLVLAGDPVSEPVSMMSSGIVGGTPQEIRKAFQEYTCGSMGSGSPTFSKRKFSAYDSDCEGDYDACPSSGSSELSTDESESSIAGLNKLRI
ncbi:unnamed protein product [Chondrus crispus]|uniref:Pirin N-terminal domain-containing protein n=1 Tax=Chondrus crispus TaxID=2769 RepID=R7QFH0_CHOCR|nr:unnamed protein product [Chondrus crispus]CDF36201.1 unnamed protein product [Chondrus crispus]|eukprot:XP_005716020.1 unnamed protein product [Chondrus crispus]